jgi:hypothetical protein
VPSGLYPANLTSIGTRYTKFSEVGRAVPEGRSAFFLSANPVIRVEMGQPLS